MVIEGSLGDGELAKRLGGRRTSRVLRAESKVPSPLMGEGEGGGERTMVSRLAKVARSLRRRSTDAERLLWRRLRARQLDGLKFRRQEPIGKYIVDFVCFERRVIVEVDGGGHAAEKGKDSQRDGWLRERGFKVLRFWNTDVIGNTDAVIEAIAESCVNHPPPAPPIKGGE